MAKQTYTFKGTASWLLSKPNKWGKFTMNFYPASAAVRKEVKDTGIRNKINEDDEGNFYYVFRSDTPYPIMHPDGTAVTELVGNRSEVTVRLSVETFESAQHGTVTRSKLEGVVVDKLIPYKKAEEKAQEGLPA